MSKRVKPDQTPQNAGSGQDLLRLPHPADIKQVGRLVRINYLGPVVRSIVSLTDLLVVNMSTVLVSTIILFTGIFAEKL